MDMDREGFGIFWCIKSIGIEMKLGKMITYIICDMLEFSWIYLRIFLIEIFQMLEIGRIGFEGFCPIF